MVTGAGGYIGTQLVRDLVKAGHEVTAVDRFFFGKEPLSEFEGSKKVTIKQTIGRIHTDASGKAVIKFLVLQNTPTLNPTAWLNM